MIKKNIRRILIISGIILVTPILLFVLKFHNHEISSSISDWSAFGGYVNGTINTLVSILSLIILAYLTYLIARNTNDENRNLYFLQRKMEAYDKLLSFQAPLNIIPFRLAQLAGELARQGNENFEMLNISSDITKEFYISVNGISEFHYFIRGFDLRYGHLFKYNFNQPEFNNLIKLAQRINETFIDHYNSLLSKSGFKEASLEDYLKMSDELTTFVSKLKKELK